MDKDVLYSSNYNQSYNQKKRRETTKIETDE